MDWINNYEVTKDAEYTIVSGSFINSAGDFMIRYQGDGGNADTFEITLTGGQYDVNYEKPMRFTITGAWEIREVIQMFKTLEKVMS